MRAYKRWDVSGTQAWVSIVGARLSDDAEMSVLVHEIPDGVSTILDPVAVIIRRRDGTEERIEIESVEKAEGRT